MVQAAFGHYVERLGGPPRPMTDDDADVGRGHPVTVAERRGDRRADRPRSQRRGLPDRQGRRRPSRQGSGVGRALLERAELAARRAGFDSIYLYAHERMSESLARYGRIGYVEYDRRLLGEACLVYLRKKLG